MVYVVYSVSLAERDVPSRTEKWTRHLHSRCYMFSDQASSIENLNRRNASDLYFRVIPLECRP